MLLSEAIQNVAVTRREGATEEIGDDARRRPFIREMNLTSRRARRLRGSKLRPERRSEPRNATRQASRCAKCSLCGHNAHRKRHPLACVVGNARHTSKNNHARPEAPLAVRCGKCARCLHNPQRKGPASLGYGAKGGGVPLRMKLRAPARALAAVPAARRLQAEGHTAARPR